MKEGKDTFVIGRDDVFMIYGAGERGQLLKEQLVRRQFRVAGYIDRRTDQQRDLPVYGMDRLPEMDKSGIIVVISLSNGALHREICEALHEAGFVRLIFVPMDYPSHARIVRDMYACYERLFGGEPTDDLELAIYPAFGRLKFSEDAAIIDRNAEELVVWMNYQIVYSLNSKDWKLDRSKIFASSWYHDKNIGMFTSYIKLMRCLNGEDDDYGFYLRQFAGGGPSALSDKLRERERLFRVYQQELNFGMDFFKLSAPPAERNDKGYFNLLDGHHRTIFLYAMHHHYLPVRIRKADFEKWVNRPRLDQVLEYMRSKRIDRLAAPVPHPAFMHVPAMRENAGKTILSALFEDLSDLDIGAFNVLDGSGYQGYFARNYRPMARGKVTCIDPDDITGLLNALMYCDDIEPGTWEEVRCRTDEAYDILFLMDHLGHVADPEQRRSFIRLVSRITKRRMYWESATGSIRDEINEILQYSDFLKYRKIHQYFRDGRMVEVGCFSHD